jgi:hypothetical protein
MNTVLRQLSLAVGAVLFCVSLILSLAGGITFLPAVFRGLVVMFLGSMAAALFFRCFMGILYTSILQRMEEQRKAQDLARSQNRGI